jgi:NAD dependent epimerase/dehydratase family enzyme
MSWISIDDAVGVIRHALLAHLHGPLNATAPQPVINRDFTHILGRILRRPTPFRIPAGALRLVLGEMADSTLLASARVQPGRLLQSGYRFEYPELEGALRHVLGKEPYSNFPA